MFTGIIESIGTITAIEKEGTNLHLSVQSTVSPSLKIDQSISHNGVCLTVIALEDDVHTVTAIQETLDRSNLGELHVGNTVNLERAMSAQARLDGHIIQGHVDQTGTCIGVEQLEGSWKYTFRYPQSEEHILVDKGSVCINGVSLTVVDPVDDQFSVAIIPYTYENTTFNTLKAGDSVNLEFDVIGKYIAKHIGIYLKAMVK
ncbi:MAG: riboflavin synthase [Bacteroidota bacterium]